MHPSLILARLRLHLRGLRFLGWWLAATGSTLSAQVPSPSPTPDTVLSVPGVPSASGLEAYNAARTPLASVALGPSPIPAAGLTNATTPPKLATEAPALQPVATGGVFPQVSLNPAVAAPGKNAAHAAAASTQTVPPPAAVTLTYSVDRAGDAVWVQALHGGTLSALGEQDQTVTTTTGFFMVIGAAGTITFSYQAPAASNTYQVLTRLDNVTTTLNFLVPDPEP